MIAKAAELNGMKELQEKLGGLKRSFRNRILRKGVRAGARVQANAEKMFAPRRYGILKRSIGVRVTTTKKDGVVIGISGPKRRQSKMKDGKEIIPTKYSHLVEKGARVFQKQPKDTTKKGKKALSFTLNGRRVALARTIQGFKGKRFMERAASASQGSALVTFQGKVSVELAIQAAKAKPNETDDGN